MTTKTKSNKIAIAELNRVIDRLELWQARHAGKAEVSELNRPKTMLMDFVRKMEQTP